MAKGGWKGWKNDKGYLIRKGIGASQGWGRVGRGKARGPTIGKQDCWWSAAEPETRKCRSRIPISHDPTAAIRAPQYSVFLCTAVIIITPAGAFLSSHLLLAVSPCEGRERERERGESLVSPPFPLLLPPLFLSPPRDLRTFKLDRSFLSRYDFRGILTGEEEVRRDLNLERKI